MYKRDVTRTLTRTANAHVTTDEEQRVKDRAAECGLTKSEWCRQVLLEALDSTQGTRLLLSEVMALRMVIVRLYTDLLQGIDVSDARLAAILQKADLEKFNLADKRIQKFHSEILKPEQVQEENGEEDGEEDGEKEEE